MSTIKTWQEVATEKHGTTILPRYELTTVMQAEIDKLRAELEKQSKAADHWMTEANTEHNKNVVLEAELAAHGITGEPG